MKKSLHVIIFLLICCLLCTLVACDGTSGADAGADKGKLSPTAPSNILVAYFSCTNNTKGIAQKIADATGGELYEILPSQPYTQEDLAYGNSSCRANNEQNSVTARPAISGSVQDMAKYEVVYLGYPIWWSKAPKIIYTFLESYEFAGKTIVPFCTSGGSPIDGSLPEIQALATDATWLSGRRFDSSATSAQITTWTDGLFK